MTRQFHLRPFFSYYGSKWRIAPKYPEPVYFRIVEPFAGSAGYSLCYPHLKVVLSDTDEQVCGIWDYLIRAPESEILKLPDIPLDGSVHDFPLPSEAKWLIGSWLNKGAATFRTKPSAWMQKYAPAGGFWGTRVRERIAFQQKRIRHWTIDCKSYKTIASDAKTTYFIDPPYVRRGRHYRHSSLGIDYQQLGNWCQSLRGHVIVCENAGATWLPFRRFVDARNSLRTQKRCFPSSGVSREVIWTAL